MYCPEEVGRYQCTCFLATMFVSLGTQGNHSLWLPNPINGQYSLDTNKTETAFCFMEMLLYVGVGTHTLGGFDLNEGFNLKVHECDEKSDILQKVIDGSSNAINSTRNKLKQTVNTIIGSPFKAPEVIGVQLENALISGTSVTGKIGNSVVDKVKKLAQKFQKKEKQFIKCVESEQFDPVKEIILKAVGCVTSKADTVHSIIHSSLVEINITYNIIKTLPQLPKCGGDSKCFADYTSDFVGKFGKILLGLGSIVQKSTLGLAAVPVTLPVCLVTRSTIGPAQVFGKLIFNIVKCTTS